VEVRRLFSLMLTILLGAYVPATAESVFAVASGEGEVTMSPETLRRLLRGEMRYWDNGQPVAIGFIEGSRCVSAIEEAAGMPFSQLKYTWTRLAFTGRGFEVRTFSSVDRLLQFMEANNGALVCLPAAEVTDRLRVIRFP
jgi:hypothetical protein